MTFSWRASAVLLTMTAGHWYDGSKHAVPGLLVGRDGLILDLCWQTKNRY